MHHDAVSISNPIPAAAGDPYLSSNTFSALGKSQIQRQDLGGVAKIQDPTTCRIARHFAAYPKTLRTMLVQRIITTNYLPCLLQ